MYILISGDKYSYGLWEHIYHLIWGHFLLKIMGTHFNLDNFTINFNRTIQYKGNNTNTFKLN